MSLIHYGFSREEVYWMPIGELEDYILLLNQEAEEQEKAAKNETSSIDKTPKVFADVFNGIGNPLAK